MWQVTEKRNIFSLWISWHYVVALENVYLKWRDILRFNLDYFSIPFLIKTLFAPWKRYNLSLGRGFDISRITEAVVFNTFSRLMGAIMRISVIFIGLIMQLLILFFGIFIILSWILLPLMILVGLFTSLQWLILN